MTVNCAVPPSVTEDETAVMLMRGEGMGVAGASGGAPLSTSTDAFSPSPLTMTLAISPKSRHLYFSLRVLQRFARPGTTRGSLSSGSM